MRIYLFQLRQQFYVLCLIFQELCYKHQFRANNSISSPDYLQSKELAIQSALFRILKERDELENAIAEITYRELNYIGPDERVDDEVVNDYASHLRYCINNPKAMRDYKLK